MLVMAAGWETTTITLDEYMADPDRYVKLSSSGGRTQVFVQDAEGETILILGTGPITPPTLEELEASAKLEAEIEAIELPDDYVPDTSWFD